MAEQDELQLQENTDEKGKSKSKSKLLIFGGIGLLVLIVIAVVLWLFLGGEKKEVAPAAEAVKTEQKDTTREAFYVAMPRPFLFNLPGNNQTRVVEIKVQLMVRGSDDDTVLKKHIPLVEDALLTTFSGASVDKLSTQAGKDELRQLALLNVQNTLQPVTGRKLVEKVLFTGFVMQ
ncbi:flagellar basal body-associated protein FliL [Shewanella yunxiaonensis]|uniref:Flagellar protein FliL n=1 Tax=Shewanella yunxiaonensis TaxID=2829809 RepID=A0ABX7YX52_9GAMM|nr:flagellar basal body-associated protein FliL [Shewanella yunxiaonensis]QUN06859.1 flagellar basal body-associated protein FliL [Shewanella yunxiaonensis]